MGRICPAVMVIMAERFWQPDRYVRKGLTDECLCCCTSMGQDGSIELEMRWIGLVVAELQHLRYSPEGSDEQMRMWLQIYGPRQYGANRSSGCPQSRDGQTDGSGERLFYNPITFLRKSRGQQRQWKKYLEQVFYQKGLFVFILRICIWESPWWLRLVDLQHRGFNTVDRHTVSKLTYFTSQTWEW